MNYNSKQEVVNNVWDDEDLRHKGQMMVTVWAFAIILALDDAWAFAKGLLGVTAIKGQDTQ